MMSFSKVGTIHLCECELQNSYKSHFELDDFEIDYF